MYVCAGLALAKTVLWKDKELLNMHLFRKLNALDIFVVGQVGML